MTTVAELRPPIAGAGSSAAPETVDALAIAAVIKTTFIDLPLALGLEFLRFAGGRLQAQSKHLANLSRCRSAMEIVDVQVRFAGAASAEYGHEAAAVARTAHDVMATKSGAAVPAPPADPAI